MKQQSNHPNTTKKIYIYMYQNKNIGIHKKIMFKTK